MAGVAPLPVWPSAPSLQQEDIRRPFAVSPPVSGSAGQASPQSTTIENAAVPGLRPRENPKNALPALTVYTPDGGARNTFFKPDGFAGPAPADTLTPSGVEKPEATRCETCANRKYQDQSNDAGVSFKAPRHIAPGATAAVVASHEREHVAHELASASRNGQRITKLNVRLFTSVCPECGRVYVSGGMTEVAKKAKSSTISEELLGVLFDGLA